MALAKLFKVYCQCSSRIVIAAATTTQTTSSSSSSSLVDRRKHIIRVMLVGLNLIATVDNAYYRHLRDYYQNATVSSTTAIAVTPTVTARKAACYGSLLLALNGCLYARQGLVRTLCSGTSRYPLLLNIPSHTNFSIPLSFTPHISTPLITSLYHPTRIIAH